VPAGRKNARFDQNLIECGLAGAHKRWVLYQGLRVPDNYSIKGSLSLKRIPVSFNGCQAETL